MYIHIYIYMYTHHVYVYIYIYIVFCVDRTRVGDRDREVPWHCEVGKVVLTDTIWLPGLEVALGAVARGIASVFPICFHRLIFNSALRSCCRIEFDIPRKSFVVSYKLSATQIVNQFCFKPSAMQGS